MLVNKVLNVTMEEMDAFIKDMVVQDIYHATGKKIKVNDIKPGYKYHKKLKARSGKEGKVTTHIDQLSSGDYKASFSSAQGLNKLSYHYEGNKDGKITLNYEENYDANSKSQALNYQLMNFLYKHSNKRRINLMLTHIEELIQQNRKPVA